MGFGVQLTQPCHEEHGEQQGFKKIRFHCLWGFGFQVNIVSNSLILEFKPATKRNTRGDSKKPIESSTVLKRYAVKSADTDTIHGKMGHTFCF